MNELLSLKPMQMDALREVANIGAGHAATALSQMTSQRIMISVPRISVTPLEDVPPHIGMPEEPVAAVLMNMLGDLTGRTLLVFPRETAMRVAEMMLSRPRGSCTELGTLEQSAIMEAGNILNRDNDCCLKYELESEETPELTLDTKTLSYLPISPSLGFIWRF